MKGLPEKFRHAPDELYAKLRGPAKNLTVLATAFSAPSTGGTGRNEPILMAIDYGKGRVFHSTMGHGPAQCLSVAFIVTLQRGAEWAATGKVTQKVPDDFPRPDKPVVRDWEKWRQSKQVVALASKEKDQSPGPWNDPADMSVWPNRVSHANSDPWLVFNHDKIRSMHPRVLLINFSNEQSAEQLMGIARQLIAALAEASRYHGYADQKAPAFLNYEVFKFVDLRDADRTKGDSRKVPLKNAGSRDGVDMSHAAYFSDQFAAYYKVPDPAQSQQAVAAAGRADRSRLRTRGVVLLVRCGARPAASQLRGDRTEAAVQRQLRAAGIAGTSRRATAATRTSRGRAAASASATSTPRGASAASCTALATAWNTRAPPAPSPTSATTSPSTPAWIFASVMGCLSTISTGRTATGKRFATRTTR